MNLLILNYGTCNINSIYNSLKKIKKIKIEVNNFNIKKFDKIILPGQGHIETCVNFIKSIPNFKEEIKKKITLGICIGYHIFYNKSEEDETVNGLNFIREKIVKIKKTCCINNFIPNIGWNQVEIIKYHEIFKNIPKIINQYFMHSYSCVFKNQKNSFAITNYNFINYNSIVIENNKILFQFHPEKSGKIGLKLLKNFLDL